MKGEVLDLPFRQIFCVIWLQGHTIVAHPAWTMFAHPLILAPFDLTVLFIEKIVQRRLLHSFPRVSDIGGWICGLRMEGDILLLRHRSSIQSSFSASVGEAIRCASLLCRALLVAEEELISMPWNPSGQLYMTVTGLRSFVART